MTRSKEITLISPPTNTYRTPEECLGLEYLVAESRNRGHKVHYLDAWMEGLTLEQTVKRITDKNCEVVAISPSMDSVPVVIRIVRSLRENNYNGQIVLGGIYASFEAESILAAIGPQVDGILAGEADETFQEFLTSGNIKDIPGAIYFQEGKVIRNPRQEVCDNLDSLPFPSRDTLPLVRNFKTPSHVMGSRGCRGNCSFCSVACYQKFSTEKRWRGRSPESIVAELVSLSEQGEDMVKFVDDNFFGDRKDKQRELHFADLMRGSGLRVRFRLSLRVDDVREDVVKRFKEVGLFAVSLGVESFVPRKLRDFSKGTTVEQNVQALETLYRNGIYVQMGHIMFDPFTTLEEIEQELSYLERFNWAVTKGICTKLFAADGTRITERLRQEVGFTEKEGANNLYLIIDPQARNYYQALRSWTRNLNHLYEQVIDPISSPKNVSPAILKNFHDLYLALKELDLGVARRLLATSSNERDFGNVVSEAKRELFAKLKGVEEEAVKLYQQTGLVTGRYGNKRI